MKSTHTEFNPESKAVNPLESNRSRFITSFFDTIRSSWRGFSPLEFQIYVE
jgi:phage-related protein